MNTLVAGGAGFLGSHLCERLLKDGHLVWVIDDLSTGRISNMPTLCFWHKSITDSAIFNKVIYHSGRHSTLPAFFDHQLDAVFNLASPASPDAYQRDRIHTLWTNVTGTKNLLQLASHHNARYLQASTSEVYGDPLQHPQREEYWGNVNPIGPRACYDEGKRAAECLVMDFHRQHSVDTRIARIFNTYGPRMRPDDGRVISNFICQALEGVPLTIHGCGNQTRSFCYVDDMVDGLVKLMEYEGDDAHMPVNLGSDCEIAIADLGTMIMATIGLLKNMTLPSGKKTVAPWSALKQPAREDDPAQRKPHLFRAMSLLDWYPGTGLSVGLEKTIAWFRKELKKEAETA